MTLGRPTVYTSEIADEICERLASGESLRSICRDERFPGDSTVRAWAIDDRDGFSARYARARDLGADAIADEILEVADDGSNDWIDRHLPDGGTERVLDHEHVARSKLRVDSRKWLLSKMAPNRYGDRTVTTLVGADGGPVQLEAVRSKLTQRLDAIAQGFEEAAGAEALKVLEGPK